jgi:hypothetical protein
MAEPKATTPLNMRPRSTPNAELNAQNRERVVREITGEAAPEVKDVPLRGYNKGGTVKPGAPKVSAPCKDTKTIKCY